MGAGFCRFQAEINTCRPCRARRGRGGGGRARARRPAPLSLRGRRRDQRVRPDGVQGDRGGEPARRPRPDRL